MVLGPGPPEPRRVDHFAVTLADPIQVVSLLNLIVEENLPRNEQVATTTQCSSA